MEKVKNVLGRLGSLFCVECAKHLEIEGEHSALLAEQYNHCDNCGAPLFTRTYKDLTKTYGSSFYRGDVVFFLPGRRDCVTTEAGGEIVGIAAEDSRYSDETVRIE